jgi:chromosome segregation ATPase
LSLEENVIDLNQAVQMLQQQVNVLIDKQKNTDDGYTNVKQDTATLQARIQMLEWQLWEHDLRAEEHLREEQKKHQELLMKAEKEKQLQMDSYAVRLEILEQEGKSLREECKMIRLQVESLRAEKEALEKLRREEEVILSALNDEVQTLRDAERIAKDEVRVNSQMVKELNLEVERLKIERKGVHSQSELDGNLHDHLIWRLGELQDVVNSLRQQNNKLQEATEELQVQLKTRDSEKCCDVSTRDCNGKSLAQELEEASAYEPVFSPWKWWKGILTKRKCLKIFAYIMVIIFVTAMYGITTNPLSSFTE